MSSELLRLLPFSFYLAAATMVILTIETIIRRADFWFIASGVVYFMIGLWYFADLYQQPDKYTGFPEEMIDSAYLQVFLFLISYRGIMHLLRKRHLWRLEFSQRETVVDETSGTEGFETAKSDQVSEKDGPEEYPVGTGLKLLVPVWLILVLIGAWRMDWDLWGALFPVWGRTGVSMWARAAVGGPTDFLVSIGGYLYVFVCAMFGILFVLASRLEHKLCLVALMALSLPQHFLLGIRNQLLAVTMPGILTYLLISRTYWMKRLLFASGILIIINYLMLAMLQFRSGGGFYDFLAAPLRAVDRGGAHEGLGMIEELIWINGFYQRDMLHLTYGLDYLAHAGNGVPRVLWPNKPQISREYSLLRGQRETEDWITATIATGLIGQGFINFGPLFGPIAAALLIAAFVNFLVVQWSQRHLIGRLSLCLVGIGILPNLGREFTPLVLWPLIFGYVAVRLLELRVPQVVEEDLMTTNGPP